MPVLDYAHDALCEGARLARWCLSSTVIRVEAPEAGGSEMTNDVLVCVLVRVAAETARAR
jgi:hypothetical protein